MEANKEDKYFKKSYSVKCSECGREFRIGPSILHKMGMLDMGGANCPECKTRLQMILDYNTNEMIAKRDEMFVKKDEEI